MITDAFTGTSPGGRPVDRWRTRGLIAWIGSPYLTATVILSALGVVMALDPENGSGGSLAPLMMMTVTLPVLLAGAAPVLAGGLLAVGAVANEVVIGSMVRCGVVLPVLFLISYQLGAASESLARRTRALGGLSCVAVALMELRWDPVLDDSAAIFVVSLGLGLFCAGLLISSRTRLVQALRQRTVELSEQRNKTAELAVAADRTRVGSELENLIRTQIRSIAISAEQAGSAARNGTDKCSRVAFAEVEASGRETLSRMRDVVGTLRDPPTDPPPGLGQLADLIRRSCVADARFSVVGDARPLSTNVELSAYRIVEQLLFTPREHTEVTVDVVVHFLPNALDIRVSGPADLSRATSSARESSMRSVRARAELHGGSVRTGAVPGRQETSVRLPLLSTAAR